ncbi:MAG: DUF4870 domain-containing protein [Planctomycetota bacterium]|jgi:uncharacterized Tic20 family protein
MAKAKEPVESSESPKEKETEKPSKVEEPVKSEVIETNKDARTWAMFCHLAGLGWLIFWLMPVIGGVICPLILWQIKKEEYSFVDEQGKEAVNFQISMLLYWIVAMLLCFVVCIGAPLVSIVFVVDIVLVIVAAIKAGEGYSYRYPFCIRFIK